MSVDGFFMQLEESTELSQSELKKLADFLPYPIIISEQRENKDSYLFFNKNFIEKIGYRLSDISGTSDLVELLYPDTVYREKIIEKWTSQTDAVKKKAKGFVKIKAQLSCRSGEKKWYEIKGSIINNLHITAFVNINSDVLLKEKLKRKNLNNDRMLSILGHDLKSPIINLLSVSTLAEQSEISQQEFIEIMQLIKEDSLDALKLLDTTFNWARMNFNNMKPLKEAIDFEVLISGVLKVYKSSYENKSITVTVKTEKLNGIRSDVEILTVILRNIISNAIKFTPKDGHISITAEENVLIISDSGIGMNQQMVDSILNHNYKTRRGTENEKGIGVGLQLVQNLVSKINCSIEIKSDIASGTAVRLYFDLS